MGVYRVLIIPLGLAEGELGPLDAVDRVGAVDGVEDVPLLHHVAFLKVGGEDVAPHQALDLVGLGGLDGAVLAVDIGDAAAGGFCLDVGSLRRGLGGADLRHPHHAAHYGGARNDEQRPPAPEEAGFPARRGGLRAAASLRWLFLEHSCASLSVVPGDRAALLLDFSIAGIS